MGRNSTAPRPEQNRALLQTCQEVQPMAWTISVPSIAHEADGYAGHEGVTGCGFIK